MFGTRRAVALSTTALAPISAHVPGATYLMSEGDSNTSTNGPTFNPYSVIYANTTIPAVVTFKDAAIGGSTLANMVSREATDIAYIGSNPNFTNYILSVWDGVNEKTNGTYYPSGAAQFATDLASYVAAMRTGGFLQVIGLTMPNTTYGTQSVTDAWVDAMNVAIRGLYPATFDAIVDLGADPRLGGHNAAANTKYFTDGIHLTNLGQLIAERLYAGAVNKLIQPLPGQPTSLATGTMTSTTAPLTWTAPAYTDASGGGYPYTYLVQYALHSSGSWSTFAHAISNAPAITVTGLTASTSYDFRVYAVSQSGNGTVSSTATASTSSGASDTLDTVNIGSSLALSNGNLTVTNTGGGAWASARTSISKSSGKWYAEIALNVVPSPYTILGVTDTTPNAAAMESNLGAITNSAGITPGGYQAVVGFTSVGGSPWSIAAGNVIGIAFDATNKQAWLAINNVWQGSGNPAGGTNPFWTWTGAYSICPAWCAYTAASQASYQPSGAQSYSPPSGFTAL